MTMKAAYLLVTLFAVLFALAAAGAYADNYNQDQMQTYQGNGNITCCPQNMVCSPGGCGAGPSWDCCNVPPTTCGAFCAAGQAPVGWPYNWCDDYWLRPDSNL
jgi:hypothetical protein